jgi:hypothetical protein
MAKRKQSDEEKIAKSMLGRIGYVYGVEAKLGDRISVFAQSKDGRTSFHGLFEREAAGTIGKPFFVQFRDGTCTFTPPEDESVLTEIDYGDMERLASTLVPLTNCGAFPIHGNPHSALALLDGESLTVLGGSATLRMPLAIPSLYADGESYCMPVGVLASFVEMWAYAAEHGSTSVKMGLGEDGLLHLYTTSAYGMSLHVTYTTAKGEWVEHFPEIAEDAFRPTEYVARTYTDAFDKALRSTVSRRPEFAESKLGMTEEIGNLSDFLSRTALIVSDGKRLSFASGTSFTRLREAKLPLVPVGCDLVGGAAFTGSTHTHALMALGEKHTPCIVGVGVSDSGVASTLSLDCAGAVVTLPLGQAKVVEGW